MTCDCKVLGGDMCHMGEGCRAFEKVERLTLQRAGNHPAPCARHCEANAYEIEIRRVSAERDEATRRSRLAERNLLDAQEAGKKMAKQAFDAERERDALVAKLKDAEHDRDEFRRVMNGFAEKLAELEGQEPVAWAVMNGWAIDGIERSEKDAMAVSAELQKSHDLSGSLAAYRVSKLYARPVPAEPVNARLLEAIKRLSFCAQTTGGTAGRDEELCAAIGEAEKAIAAAEAQQDRLLQDMHDAGREIDRVMAECFLTDWEKEQIHRQAESDVLSDLLGSLREVCETFSSTNRLWKDTAVHAMAQRSIARAEAAPKAVRLTHPDIAKALASAGLKPEDCREDGEILPLVLAIESAALRKNGIEVAE